MAWAASGLAYSCRPSHKELEWLVAELVARLGSPAPRVKGRELVMSVASLWDMAQSTSDVRWVLG